MKNRGAGDQEEVMGCRFTVGVITKGHFKGLSQGWNYSVFQTVLVNIQSFICQKIV